MKSQPQIDRVKFQEDLGKYFRYEPNNRFLVFDNTLRWEEPGNYRDYIDPQGIDTLIVKVGTAVVTHEQSTRMSYNINQIASDLSRLRRERGLNILLITSGAIGLGRKERLRRGEKIKEGERNTPRQKQLDAIKGQPKLFELWRDYFQNHSQQIGEKLVTHDDFRHEKRTERLLEEYERWLSRGRIVVANEDDARSLEEIDISMRGTRIFRDNDGLTSLHAQLLKKEGYNPLVLLLSNTDGIYTAESFKNGEYKPIRIIKNSKGLEKEALPISSPRGRGGMISKIDVGRELSEQNIEVIIANGQFCNHDTTYQKGINGSQRKYDAIDSALNGRVVGTRFIPNNHASIIHK